ncbi:hypothetical protein ACHAPT_011124 [Fusarium lateritium]
MKFSTAALFTLAHGIFAMPQVSDKINEMVKRSAQADGNEICWLACFSEEPDCPEKWHSKELGECWTCCASTDELQ